MKPVVVILALAAVVLTAGLLLANRGNHSIVPDGARDGGASRLIPGSQLSAEEVDRQDPPDPKRQRNEARAHDQRPLLNALPVTLRGVTFSIGGLDQDNRTTVIRADAHGLGDRHARITYKVLRRKTGDRSPTYRLDISP